jgi:hypothetical protein
MTAFSLKIMPFAEDHNKLRPLPFAFRVTSEGCTVGGKPGGPQEKMQVWAGATSHMPNMARYARIFHGHDGQFLVEELQGEQSGDGGAAAGGPPHKIGTYLRLTPKQAPPAEGETLTMPESQRWPLRKRAVVKVGFTELTVLALSRTGAGAARVTAGAPPAGPDDPGAGAALAPPLLRLISANGQIDKKIGPEGATIGRSADTTIHMQDAQLSRTHAAIEYDAETDAFCAVDLGSTNGTYVRLRGLGPPTLECPTSGAGVPNPNPAHGVRLGQQLLVGNVALQVRALPDETSLQPPATACNRLRFTFDCSRPAPQLLTRPPPSVPLCVLCYGWSSVNQLSTKSPPS